jgi:DNA-binding IscR family transcriptional regulator
VKKSIKDVLTSITLKDLTEEKRRKSSDVVK